MLCNTRFWMLIKPQCIMLVGKQQVNVIRAISDERAGSEGNSGWINT
jgi:hypothetical protein